MDNEHVSELLLRVAKLERGMRSYRRVGAVLLVCALAGVVTLAGRTAAAGPRVIEGDILVLKDAQGKMRIMAGGAKNGRYGISVMDAKENARAMLSTEADGQTALVFKDSSGNEAMTLTVRPDGLRRLEFPEIRGGAYSSFGLDATGDVDLYMTRSKGDSVLLVSTPVAAGLQLKQGTEKKVWMLNATR